MQKVIQTADSMVEYWVVQSVGTMAYTKADWMVVWRVGMKVVSWVLRMADLKAVHLVEWMDLMWVA